MSWKLLYSVFGVFVILMGFFCIHRVEFLFFFYLKSCGVRRILIVMCLIFVFFPLPFFFPFLAVLRGISAVSNSLDDFKKN